MARRKTSSSKIAKDGKFMGTTLLMRELVHRQSIPIQELEAAFIAKVPPENAFRNADKVMRRRNQACDDQAHLIAQGKNRIMMDAIRNLRATGLLDFDGKNVIRREAMISSAPEEFISLLPTEELREIGRRMKEFMTVFPGTGVVREVIRELLRMGKVLPESKDESDDKSTEEFDEVPS